VPKFRAMTFEGPLGSTEINPSLEYLQAIIFDQPESYWQAGSGDSSMAVVEHLGPKRTAALEGEPALMLFLVEPHGFFFDYFDNTEKFTTQFVPLSEDSNGPPWVQHYVCGEAFYAPKSCFVSRQIAWEIVAEFLQTKRRSNAVNWVERSTLRFPNPAAGDKVPRQKDLA
jgi:hypothetical protein